MRRSLRWRLIWGLICAVAAGGCAEDRSTPAAVDRSATPTHAPAPAVADPLTEQAVEATRTAITASQKLSASIIGRQPRLEAYRAMRRATAAARPYFRARAQMGSEVLIGPLVSVAEGGGALGALDAALDEGDMDAAKRAMTQTQRALRLIETELRQNKLPPGDAGQVLSDACFELGLVLLEADPMIALSPETVMMDIHGLLDGIEDGARALVHDDAKAQSQLDELMTLVEGTRRRLGETTSSHELSGRAILVRMSAGMGVAARRLAAALDLPAKLPYKARFPIENNNISEPISPLTLPAPRIDKRKGDRKKMVALGRALFFDKRLSAAAQRSCADCHQPAKAFADGRPTPTSLVAGKPIKRNTPTLLYTSLHGAQLWDGQLASAESQALKVIHTDSEMGLSDDELLRNVSAGHGPSFEAAFEDGVTKRNIARALVAFEIADLVVGTTPLDRFDRGELDALTPEDHRGFDVFVGIGRCARCHIPPLFGGSRPTDFAVPVFAALGVTRSPDKDTPDGKTLDPDRGRGKITKQAIDAHAFKTPTVRNIALTAPYFHNGAFATLEQVVDFYDEGGGVARGVKLDNQDPDVRKLDLGDARKALLLRFMRTALADRDLPTLDTAAD